MITFALVMFMCLFLVAVLLVFDLLLTWFMIIVMLLFVLIEAVCLGVMKLFRKAR